VNCRLENKRALVTGGSRGITINNIQPGPVETDMNPATSDFAKMLVQQVMAIPRTVPATKSLRWWPIWPAPRQPM
jgi:NAD(P)-dependent dehydrogenase (short-subunit alcohol dehydrogenase family)